MELRKILENKLFALIEPGAHGGPDHLREWIRSLDGDELIEMFGTMMHASGHKAGSRGTPLEVVSAWRGTEMSVVRSGSAALVNLTPVKGSGSSDHAWTVWELSGGGSKVVRIACDGGIITLEELACRKV